MKRILTFFVIGLLVSGCSNNDENEINCSLFDPLFPELYLKLVDENGVNLIENGTFDPNNITVEGNFSNPGFRYNPAHEYAEPDADIRKYDHTLYLFIPRESQFEYTINLNDTTSIVLAFEAELTEIPCDLSYFLPTKISFNNEVLELVQEESDLKFLTIVQLQNPAQQ